MTWNNDFWTRLGGEQPSLRLDMYYRRRDDLRLPVELVAGEPRVPVDAHVLALLDRVDQDVLFERVKDDRQRKNWTTNAAAVRAAAGKTVSLYSAVVATLVPIGATKRQTINLNVYAGLSFKVDALREMVDPDVREALAPLKKPFASAYDIAPLLGIATPHSTQDESATETEEPAEEPPGTEPTAATVAWDQHYNLIFFGPPGTGKSFQLQQIVASHLRATDDRVYRVTFHPEYSYFDFVGTYKPRVGWMKSLNDFTDADRRPHTNREPRVYYGHERRDLAKRQASDPRASATSCAPVNIPCLTTVRPLRARLRSRPHTARDGSGLGALAHVDRGRARRVGNRPGRAWRAPGTRDRGIPRAPIAGTPTDRPDSGPGSP